MSIFRYLKRGYVLFKNTQSYISLREGNNHHRNIKLCENLSPFGMKILIIIHIPLHNNIQSSYPTNLHSHNEF